MSLVPVGSGSGATARFEKTLEAETLRRAATDYPINDLAEGVRDVRMSVLSDDLAALRDAKVEIEAADGLTDAASMAGAWAQAEARADEIVAVGLGHAQEIAAIRQERDEAAIANRAYSSRYNLIPGKVLKPKWKPMALIGTAAVGEGLLTGTVFFQAGAVPTLGAGITLGLMAAGSIGVGAGLIGGHLIGRHFWAGSEARPSSRSDFFKRWCARTTAPIVAIGLVVQHGALATARATGSLDGAVETFLSNPLIATSTLESTLLAAFGMGTTVLAWSEGLSAFGDPDPGRARVYERTTDALDEALETAHDEALAHVGELEDDLQDWLDAIEDEVFGPLSDRPERVALFEADKAALADAVEDAISAINARHDGLIALYRSIAGKAPTAFQRIDADAVRARFRMEWSPSESVTVPARADLQACRTLITKAAADARLEITTARYGHTKED